MNPMIHGGRPIEILLVEDCTDEAELTMESLKDGQVRNRIHWVQDGESPGLKALHEEEASQLAALDSQERAEIEKVRQRYSEERKRIQQAFQQRRHSLEIGKK